MRQEAGKAGRFNDFTGVIIGACIEVHTHLGPGLLESAYEQCLCHELGLLGLRFQRQVPLTVSYKGIELEQNYRVDLIVEHQVIVEIKAVEQLHRVHQAQTLTYLTLTRLPVALLVNFGAASIQEGLRRLSLKRRSFPASRLPANPPENRDER